VPAVRVADQCPGLRGGGEQLLDEERHARRSGEQADQPAGPCRDLEAASGHFGDVVCRQRTELEQHSGPPGGHFAQQPRPGAGVGPARHHTHQPLLRGVVGEVLEHRERLRVGRMQVLEQQPHRPATPLHLQHPQQALAEHDRRLGGGRRVRPVPLGQQPAQRGAVGGARGLAAGRCAGTPRSAPRRAGGTARAACYARPVPPRPAPHPRWPVARAPAAVATCRSRPRPAPRPSRPGARQRARGAWRARRPGRRPPGRGSAPRAPAWRSRGGDDQSPARRRRAAPKGAWRALRSGDTPITRAFALRET
jgi:hypothetical protein